MFLLLSPSADCQKEAGIHQEQAFPQEGQETDQEIFIESLPPTEAHWTGERGKKKTYTQNFQQKQAATVNPPIEMNKEQQRFSRPPVIPRLLTWLEMLPSLRRVSPT